MPDLKYESDGGPSANRIASFITTSIVEPEAQRALGQFVDALIYNWLLAAPDGHAKNYSVLLAQRAVRLAPLYDAASALPYGDYFEPKIKLAMRIGRHYRVGSIGKTTWERQAQGMGLDTGVVISRALEIAKQLPDVFTDVAKSYADSSDARSFISTLTSRVIQRAQQCVALLST